MTTDLKQEYTLRISQANKTQLITILYEMVLLYIDEAKDALTRDERMEYKGAIRKIRGCMNELTASLNFDYELAHNLLQLYLYVNRELVKASTHYDAENLDAMNINTQTVYAGLTYGRNHLTENVAGSDINRGFCV